MVIRGWNDAWQPLFDGMAKLKGGWPTRGWSWDSRFMCITSSFTVEQEPKARAAVALAMTREYTSTSIVGAPQALRDVVERCGGVRSGQLVLSAGPVMGLMAFGLWWPWGDAETISFRLGLVDVDPGRDPYQKFRDVFGVSF